MPNALASRGFAITTGCRLMRIWPAFGGWAPDSARISVLLPAPLPPTRPTTSPARRSTDTSSTACTPPNETRISRISTSGAVFKSNSAMPIPLFRPAPNVGIEADRRHQHNAHDDVLGGRVDAQHDH